MAKIGIAITFIKIPTIEIELKYFATIGKINNWEEIEIQTASNILLSLNFNFRNKFLIGLLSKIIPKTLPKLNKKDKSKKLSGLNKIKIIPATEILVKISFLQPKQPANSIIIAIILALTTLKANPHKVQYKIRIIDIKGFIH